MSERYDFANILFSGHCNRKCYYCIGERLPERVNVNNLNVFPPRNIEMFVAEVNRLDIKQIVFTGTVSDPQMYHYEPELLEMLRSRIVTGAQFSVHTNGVLALKKLDVFNLYDRACISLPSFHAETYYRHMGACAVPDLERIIQLAEIPVKVSCVLDEQNVEEIPGFLERCHKIKLKRLVLRERYGERPVASVSLLKSIFKSDPAFFYRGNPVFEYRGMEVTYWNFDDATCRSINLFADGTLGTSYLLTETPQLSDVMRVGRNTGRIDGALENRFCIC